MSHRMSYLDFRKLKQGNKFKAEPKIVDGIRFDSKAEAEFYLLLKADPRINWVDVHPTFTLPGPVKYEADFQVYLKLEDGAQGVEVIDVKGKETEKFKVVRKLFDRFHPCAPLKVFRRRGEKWESL